MAHTFTPNITYIFNQCIISNNFSYAWKRANVVAIWRITGQKTIQRIIAPFPFLLPVLARVFEKILAKQLMGFCRVNNVIPPEQFGFRDSSSCEFALLTALNSWMDLIDSGKVVGALLIDLSKAFDMVHTNKFLWSYHLLDAVLILLNSS